MCLISWARTRKGDPHKLFRGDFGVKKGVPNGPFSATKSLVYCFFLSLLKLCAVTPVTDLPSRGPWTKRLIGLGLRGQYIYLWPLATHENAPSPESCTQMLIVMMWCWDWEEIAQTVIILHCLVAEARTPQFESSWRFWSFQICAIDMMSAEDLGPEQPINKKHINIILTGVSQEIVHRLSQHFPEISWEFCLCVSLFPKKNATHKQIWPPPFPGIMPRSCLQVCLLSRLLWGPTGPSWPDLPLWPGPSLNTSIWTRFWPDLDLKSPFSGPNQVQGEVFREGPGQSGRSGRDGPVGPQRSYLCLLAFLSPEGWRSNPWDPENLPWDESSMLERRN